MARKAKLRYSPPIKPPPKKRRKKFHDHTFCYTETDREIREFYELIRASGREGKFGFSGLTANLVLRVSHHRTSTVIQCKDVADGEVREFSASKNGELPTQANDPQQWLPRFCRGYFECTRDDLVAERVEQCLRNGQPLSDKMVTTKEETWIALQALWAGLMGIADNIMPAFLRRLSWK